MAHNILKVHMIILIRKKKSSKNIYTIVLIFLNPKQNLYSTKESLFAELGNAYSTDCLSVLLKHSTTSTSQKTFRQYK